MANWRDDYYAALGERDEREKANSALYEAYTRLADRTSNLEPRHDASPAPPSPDPKIPPPPLISLTRRQSKRDVPSIDNLNAQLSAARQDLEDAQRARSKLEVDLANTTEDLRTIKKKATADNKKILDLSMEKTHLQQRLKDRDDELKGKAKLLDDIQAELVSTTLQMNMAEQRSNKLRVENKHLVDRWMEMKAQEAENMNNTSKFS